MQRQTQADLLNYSNGHDGLGRFQGCHFRADARKLFVRALLLLCHFPGMDPTSGMPETVFGDPGELDELDPGELVGVEALSVQIVLLLSQFPRRRWQRGGSVVAAQGEETLYVFKQNCHCCSVLGQTGSLSQISILRFDKFLEVKHLLLVFGRLPALS